MWAGGDILMQWQYPRWQFYIVNVGPRWLDAECTWWRVKVSLFFPPLSRQPFPLHRKLLHLSPKLIPIPNSQFLCTILQSFLVPLFFFNFLSSLLLIFLRRFSWIHWSFRSVSSHQCRSKKMLRVAVAELRTPLLPMRPPGIIARSSRFIPKCSDGFRNPIFMRRIYLGLMMSFGSTSIASLLGIFPALVLRFGFCGNFL